MESGEGIESRNKGDYAEGPPRIMWNPVKELKDLNLTQYGGPLGGMWNPVKELKGPDRRPRTGTGPDLLWNPVKELKGTGSSRLNRSIKGGIR